MRKADWAKTLGNVISESRNKPFEWGVNDCCLFAADCCIAVCGIDPAEPYRGTYTTEIGAKRALSKGHGSLDSAFDACFARVDAAMAMRGDICMHDTPDGAAMAVRWGGSWWALTPDGAARIDAKPLIVWRVE